MRTLLSSICILIIAFSCKKESVNPDFGFDYYPQGVGTYVDYDVLEVTHDDAVNVHDTDSYQLREKIISTFVDNSGRTAFRVERYRRDTLTDPWVIKDVWVTNFTSERLEKVEENERFIRLVFPVKANTVWNGNAYNQRDEWGYEYESVDEPFSVNNQNFSRTVRIKQRDFRAAYFWQHAEEYYAHGVGLVYKYYKNLEINLFDTTDVTKGEELYQYVIGYGVN